LVSLYSNLMNVIGSAGYGRRYIERLAGNWGVLDAADVSKAAQALAQPPHSLVDPKRLVVRGGSAGGYTVLGTLSLLPDVNIFAAGTSLYGISDLIGLSQFSHKFENPYMDKLLGGSYEQTPKVYVERSPITHADRIVVPLLVSALQACITSCS
jgi:dipeptidyl aminopeptidase/acylaminoacyl peptidase